MSDAAETRQNHSGAMATEAVCEPRFRFHDLRHQSITEMAEAGVPEAAMQSIAGHLSKKMLDHYSHVRMVAKRQAVQALGGGLIGLELITEQATRKAN